MPGRGRREGQSSDSVAGQIGELLGGLLSELNENKAREQDEEYVVVWRRRDEDRATRNRARYYAVDAIDALRQFREQYPGQGIRVRAIRPVRAD